MRLLLPDESLRVAPQSGIGRYTAELIKGFIQHEEIEELETFRRGSVQYVPVDQLSKPATNVTEKKFNRLFSRQKILEKSAFAYRLYNGLTHAYFRRLLQPYSDYIYHETNYILRPFDGISITTIHDLSIFHYPEFHPKLRVRHMHANIQRTFEQAARVITDSEFVKREIVDMFGINPENVDVIRLGVDSSFHPRDVADVQSTLRKFDLTYRQFFFVVGTIEPRKNLKRIFEAYSRLPEHLQDRFPLVLTGQRGWDNEVLLQLDQQVARGRIRFLGYLPESELKELYAAARAVLFLSLYEGFGFPVLEAVASGTPIVTSIGTAMEEIMGKNEGILVDPKDEIAISEKLLELASSPFYFRPELSSNCLCNYSWEKTTKHVMGTYRKAQI